MFHGACGISLGKAEPLSFCLPPFSSAVLSMPAFEYVNKFSLRSKVENAIGLRRIVALCI